MLIKNNRLLKQSNFKLEKDIQSFVEKHIPDILGEEYEFVCTEFSVGNFRIDTLTFNKKTKSFILIEDKNEIKVYTEEDHLAYACESLKETYEEIY